MSREEKAEAIEQIKDRFDKATSAVLLGYQGMTVAEVSDLRNKFREKGVVYRVVKNTLVKLAVKEEPFSDTLATHLKGMTAIAWSFEEPSAAAKIIKNYRKDNEKLEVKAGVLDGQVLPGDAVETQLASLPGKDEMRATLLATLMAPMQQLVMQLNAPGQRLALLLEAKRRKDAGE